MIVRLVVCVIVENILYFPVIYGLNWIPGVLWCIVAILCCFSKHEATKFQVTQYACQATNGNEYRDPIFCSHLCSTEVASHTYPILSGY